MSIAIKRSARLANACFAGSEVTTDFGYEFCFEAPNGSVKWYKAHDMVLSCACMVVHIRGFTITADSLDTCLEC